MCILFFPSFRLLWHVSHTAVSMGCWDLCLWEVCQGILGTNFPNISEMTAINSFCSESLRSKMLKKNNQNFWCNEHGHGTQKPYKSWRSKLDFQLVIVIKCRLFDLYFRRINTFQYNMYFHMIGWFPLFKNYYDAFDKDYNSQ